MFAALYAFSIHAIRVPVNHERRVADAARDAEFIPSGLCTVVPAWDEHECGTSRRDCRIVSVGTLRFAQFRVGSIWKGYFDCPCQWRKTDNLFHRWVSSTCGTSGRCATYDAFGRMVESSTGGSTWKEYWYTQGSGKMVMNGTILSYGRWPTAYGMAETVGSTNFDYLHGDWLGNSRIVSGISTHSVGADQAYTPYGEIYNIFGANNSDYQVFADMIADLAPSTTTPITWDTPNRELSYAGRFLSPDPAGFAWNQYAYPTNPNSSSDASGLCSLGGGVGLSGGCPPAWINSNCPGPGPGGCELFYGGAGAGCSDLDNSGQCVPVGLLGSGDAGASCPNNICNGYVNGQYFEFVAGAGGAQGYVTENDISQGLYEINGNFYTLQQWQAYIAQAYAPQIASQYNRTSSDAYLVFGDSASVDPNNPQVTGGHANFAISCDDLTVCGPGRYDFGIHVEYDSNGNLVVHDDTVSPWMSPASFSFSSLFSGNFWEHGFVDLVWGTLCNCVFSQ